jgi:hypothetical protein
MENIQVLIAANLIDKEFLLEVITSIISGQEFSEDIKLGLIDRLEEYNTRWPEKDLGNNCY